jgi:GTP cyclohydrolase IA
MVDTFSFHSYSTTTIELGTEQKTMTSKNQPVVPPAAAAAAAAADEQIRMNRETEVETMTIVSNSTCSPSVPPSEAEDVEDSTLAETLSSSTTVDAASTSTLVAAAVAASSTSTTSSTSSAASVLSASKNKRARLLGSEMAEDVDDDDDDDDDTDSRLQKKMQKNNQNRREKVQKMAFCCRTILECLGEDPTREGLQKTPERWAQALLDMTSGYAISPETVTNNAVFCENHHEMVVVRNIDIHSLCEHHMLPFTGRVHIGYIPNGKVIGLSKLARIAELYARRLQVQERLTSQIADAVLETVQPLGVAVVVECTHFCMVMRGVQKTGTVTTTSSVRGCFETNSKTRAEFFSILHGATRSMEMR